MRENSVVPTGAERSEASLGTTGWGSPNLSLKGGEEYDSMSR
ncbi:hypothetical protein BH10PSE6_BH10PSE6_04250 [soil metagenome]